MRWSLRHNEDVIGQHPGGDSPLLKDDNENTHRDGKEEHGKGATLWDATSSLIRGPQATSERVSGAEPSHETLVSCR